jgi:hypothetical protein
MLPAKWRPGSSRKDKKAAALSFLLPALALDYMCRSCDITDIET